MSTKKVKNTNMTNKIEDFELKRYYLPIFFGVLLIVLIIFIFLNFNAITEYISKIINVLMPIIFGLILSYILSPLYNTIIKLCKWHKKLIATIICVLVIIVVIAGMFALVIPQLHLSLMLFKSDFLGNEERINQIVKGISQIPYIGNSLSTLINNTIYNMSDIISKNLLPNLNDIAATIYTGAYFTFKIVLNFLIGIIVMIYVINMKEELILAFKKMFYAFLDKKKADKLMIELRFAHQAFSGFLVGKLLDSIIIGVLCYIGCLILQIPYAALVSVIIGITNIIPFFGPFIGAIPSFLFIVIADPIKGLIFIIFILALQQFDGNVLGPKILSNKTGVGSFYVLFSIVLIGGIFGFVGMVIAVPLWAVLSRLFWQYLDNKLKNKKLSTKLSDYKNK